MSDIIYDRILENVQRFIQLDAEERRAFESLLIVKQVPKKEFLLREGQVCKDQFYVNKGCLKKYSIDEHGNEAISMFAIEDYWTGDLLSFTKDQPSRYFVQALEDSEVLTLSKDNLELLYERVPKFNKFFRILFQRSLASFNERSDQNISLSAEDRYLNFIKKYPTLELRVSQRNIASYIGVTPEFLSRMKKRMMNK